MNAEQRKQCPLYEGVFKYFPKALLEVAKVSYTGNEQHHPGTPVHWDKSKSTDEYDAMLRHLLEVGKLDSDGMRHSAKVVWRSLAALERELDAEKEEDTFDELAVEAMKALETQKHGADALARDQYHRFDQHCARTAPETDLYYK